MGMKLNPLTGKFDTITTNAKAIDGIKIVSSNIGDGKILSYSVADNAIRYVSQIGADGAVNDIDGGNFLDSYTPANDDIDGGAF